MDPLIKSPSRAVVLKELFSQSLAKRRVKDQRLAFDFPNGTAPAQVQRRIQIDNPHEALKAAGAGTIYREKASDLTKHPFLICVADEPSLGQEVGGHQFG